MFTYDNNFLSINQSIKFNSGCLAHKEKTHTHTYKYKKNERREKLNYNCCCYSDYIQFDTDSERQSVIGDISGLCCQPIESGRPII